MTTLEVFYSFQSPYSYLALESIYDLEERFDIEVLWQPFSAKAAGQQMPVSAIVPDKLSYLLEDTKRFATANNIPFVIPESWPESEFDPGKVTRGALVAADMKVLKEYNFKVFHKWWGLGEDPNDDSFFHELADELDIELGLFLSKVSASDARERVKGIFKRGRKVGVFDTPTFVIDKERYFGIDKISQLKEIFQAQGLTKRGK